jgi:exopolyphosphatase/guanosine-5'-triphosphate,3'-diphosphate pyrophosphatase
LVLDVGGGSTELSWVDLAGAGGAHGSAAPIRAWMSAPIGVVTLAEQFPEARPGERDWFSRLVEAVKAPVAAFARADAMRGAFDAGRAHLVGTSGAITSLAGLHLGLPRYDRSKVDGLWLTRTDCDAIVERLLALDPLARAGLPCIGPERADLVLAGAAILQAVQELWPCDRVCVADRGLREGVLLSLMSQAAARRRPRRRRRGGGDRPAAVAA